MASRWLASKKQQESSFNRTDIGRFSAVSESARILLRDKKYVKANKILGDLTFDAKGDRVPGDRKSDRFKGIVGSSNPDYVANAVTGVRGKVCPDCFCELPLVEILCGCRY